MCGDPARPSVCTPKLGGTALVRAHVAPSRAARMASNLDFAEVGAELFSTRRQRVVNHPPKVGGSKPDFAETSPPLAEASPNWAPAWHAQNAGGIIQGEATGVGTMWGPPHLSSNAWEGSMGSPGKSETKEREGLSDTRREMYAKRGSEAKLVSKPMLRVPRLAVARMSVQLRAPRLPFRSEILKDP